MGGTFKSDSESAIMRVFDDVSHVRAARGADTMAETIPVGDSQAPGLAEMAVISVEDIALNLF